jgi:hypothetical protein
MVVAHPAAPRSLLPIIALCPHCETKRQSGSIHCSEVPHVGHEREVVRQGGEGGEEALAGRSVDGRVEGEAGAVSDAAAPESRALAVCDGDGGDELLHLLLIAHQSLHVHGHDAGTKEGEEEEEEEEEAEEEGTRRRAAGIQRRRGGEKECVSHVEECNVR